MNTKKKNKKAFTLIEIMIVIVIVSLISFAVYLPYVHHQKKIFLDNAVRELSQALTATRNQALHGYAGWEWNLHTYIELIPGENSLQTYTLPSTKKSLDNIWEKQADRKIQLPTGITLHSIDNTLESKILAFEAITGKLHSEEPMWDILEIRLSYKGSTHESLQNSLRYYTNTYISDY